jgi:hypothetical protein
MIRLIGEPSEISGSLRLNFGGLGRYAVDRFPAAHACYPAHRRQGY